MAAGLAILLLMSTATSSGTYGSAPVGEASEFGVLRLTGTWTLKLPPTPNTHFFFWGGGHDFDHLLKKKVVTMGKEGFSKYP